MNGGTLSASASTTTASSSGNEGIRTGTSGFGAGSGIGGTTTTATVATVPVGGESGEPGGKKKKAPKRRKVNHACLYCRRSHMTCDEGRPCQRCVKREIGHLCHDEQRPSKQDRHASQPSSETAIASTTTLYPPTASTSRSITPTTVPGSVTGTGTVSTTLPYLIQPQPQPQPQVEAQPSFYYGGYGGYGGEAFGSEFSMLSDFLETLDDSTFFSSASTTGATLSPTLMFTAYVPPASTTTGTTATNGGLATTTATTIPAPGTTTTTTTASINGVPPTTAAILTEAGLTPNSNAEPDTEDASTPSTSNQPSSDSTTTNIPNAATTTTTSTTIKIEDDAESDATQLTLPLPAPTKTEKFLLTAADQDSGLSRDERLSRVIRSKYEAGLLKPYNYVKGYARLSRWMDVNEFSQLVGVDGYLMREGRLCIYELMAEESAVNYWEVSLLVSSVCEVVFADKSVLSSFLPGLYPILYTFTSPSLLLQRTFHSTILVLSPYPPNLSKYGNVAFDSSQKAVLTSCVLRYKPILSVGGGGGSSSSTTAAGPGPGGQVVGAGLGSRFGYPAPMLPPSNSNGNKNVNGTSGAGDADAGSGVSENGTGTGGGAEDVDDQMKEAGLINCCFSFTIRRDKWGIPSMIVGNFIRC
ncbi:hypothetical protein D9758_008588 [Tetrapyrgos nigripes]|uniref:Zn(2)-C6 fungal-type domain-containing protein n=1 Tax=Tetrapyrgos nigripes TaxID=182062 RepID=A0A8H5G5P3_9AGAR|nr:hypothetical protein D9758_008588 [Tetrapyrgos nigripes]